MSHSAHRRTLRHHALFELNYLNVTASAYNRRGMLVRRTLFRVCGALGIASAVAACSNAESESVKARRPRPVRLETVSTYVARAATVFPGRVRANRQPAVSFRIPGRITELLVDVGDRVKKGTLLATLDPADFRTRVADAAASVAQAEANAARTGRAADRARRLFEGNAVSESERDQSKDLARSARARLESARQRLALARRELEYTRLVAPQGGVVTARMSDPGTNVEAGQSILQLSGERLEIQTNVPESALGATTTGAQAEARIPAVGGGFRPAQVIRVAQSAADRSVLFPVFVRLVEADARVVSGMAAEVRFAAAVAGERRLLTVSPSAIVGDPEGPFVWALEVAPKTGNGEQETLVARRRSVSVVRLTDRFALIGAGLQAGDKVATAGVNYLFDGQIVRPARLAPLVFEGTHTPFSSPEADLIPEVDRQ